jgi:hypothetical protein
MRRSLDPSHPARLDDNNPVDIIVAFFGFSLGTQYRITTQFTTSAWGQIAVINEFYDSG